MESDDCVNIVRREELVSYSILTAVCVLVQWGRQKWK